MWAGVSTSLSGKVSASLPRGVDLAIEHIGNCPAAGLSHHPGLEDGSRAIDPFAHHHRSAIIQDDDGLRLDGSYGLDQGDLLRGQVEVGPVVAFRLLGFRQGKIEQGHISGAGADNCRVDERLVESICLPDIPRHKSIRLLRLFFAVP